MKPVMIIDRIEDAIAIIECGEDNFEIPISVLPDGAKEGDQLTFSIASSIDTKQEAEERLKRLKARDTGEDIIDL